MFNNNSTSRSNNNKYIILLMQLKTPKIYSHLGRLAQGRLTKEGSDSQTQEDTVC